MVAFEVCTVRGRTQQFPDSRNGDQAELAGVAHHHHELKNSGILLACRQSPVYFAIQFKSLRDDPPISSIDGSQTEFRVGPLGLRSPRGSE